MKFSLASLAPLPVFALGAPVIGSIPTSSLNPDFAKELVGSLQAQVQPLVGSVQAQLQNMNSALAILPAGTNLDSLDLNTLNLNDLKALQSLGLDIPNVEQTVKNDITDITHALNTAATRLSSVQGLLSGPEQVSQMMHDMLNDITDAAGKLQSLSNNEEIVQQVTQMTGAFASVVTSCASIVQDFMPTFEKEISGLVSALPSTMSGLLQVLHQ